MVTVFDVLTMLFTIIGGAVVAVALAVGCWYLGLLKLLDPGYVLCCVLHRWEKRLVRRSLPFGSGYMHVRVWYCPTCDVERGRCSAD